MNENQPIKINTAMVLAAGLGTRMRPLTDEIPKPLLKVNNKALIDYTLDRFAEAGVSQAIVNVHHLAEQVEAHLANRDAPEIIISDERGVLLETGGGLKKARPHFDDAPIFCTNTDAIILDAKGTDACTTLTSQWDSDKMDALLLLIPKGDTTGYDGKGDLDRQDDGQISLRTKETAPLVFTGLQLISPALIDEGPDGAFSTRILWDLAASRGRLFGVVHEGFWLHVGDPEALGIANARLSPGRG